MLAPKVPWRVEEALPNLIVNLIGGPGRTTKLAPKFTTKVPWRVEETLPNLIVNFVVSLIGELTGKDDPAQRDSRRSLRRSFPYGWKKLPPNLIVSFVVSLIGEPGRDDNVDAKVYDEVSLAGGRSTLGWAPVVADAATRIGLCRRSLRQGLQSSLCRSVRAGKSKTLAQRGPKKLEHLPMHEIAASRDFATVRKFAESPD